MNLKHCNKIKDESKFVMTRRHLVLGLIQELLVNNKLRCLNSSFGVFYNRFGV